MINLSTRNDLERIKQKPKIFFGAMFLLFIAANMLLVINEMESRRIGEDNTASALIVKSSNIGVGWYEVKYIPNESENGEVVSADGFSSHKFLGNEGDNIQIRYNIDNPKEVLPVLENERWPLWLQSLAMTSLFAIILAPIWYYVRKK